MVFEVLGRDVDKVLEDMTKAPFPVVCGSGREARHSVPSRQMQPDSWFVVVVAEMVLALRKAGERGSTVIDTDDVEDEFVFDFLSERCERKILTERLVDGIHEAGANEDWERS